MHYKRNVEGCQAGAPGVHNIHSEHSLFPDNIHSDFAYSHIYVEYHHGFFGFSHAHLGFYPIDSEYYARYNACINHSSPGAQKEIIIMKKLLALMFAIAMVLSCLAGCQVVENEGPGKNPYNLKTVKEGYLTVATSPDYAPYEFYDMSSGKAELAGFDIAMAGYIADYLGLTLELVPMDFDGVLMEIQNGKCDLAMAGLSPRADRADIMDFSIIYYTSEQSLVTYNGKITSLEQANDKSVKIGVQTGSIQEGLAQENTPDADIISLSKVTDIIAELVTGKLDAAYIETPVVNAYKAKYEDLGIVCTIPEEDNGNIIGVNKGNEDLLKYVNEAMQKALDDGSFNTFVIEAFEAATGKIYEGVLDGSQPATGDADANN